MFEKFLELMQARNMNINQVSKATGISSTTFYEWRKGKYIPKSDKMQKIAKYFDVPVEYFLDTPALENKANSLGVDVDAEKTRFYSLSKDKASQEIIDNLGKLSPEQKSAILAVIKSFTQK